MRFTLCFLILFLASCTHDTDSVRVYHYGIGDGGGSNGVHTVHAGDTLWSISQRYNLPLRDLIDLNKSRPPYALAKGQRLLLPAPSTYKVQPKDSLYAISRLFKTSVTDLSRLNRLQSPYTIHPGQILQVPSSVGRIDLSDDEFEGQTYVSEDRQAQNDNTKTPDKKPVYTKRKAKSNVASATPAPRSSSRFMRPVSGDVISRFGPKKDSLHNDGINIKAPRGTSVRSAENGIIVYADNELEGYGNLILVKHADRYVSAYAHMDKMLGKKGAKVKRGEVIGTVGSTGSVQSPQLHFEIRRGSKALNPSQYINK